MAPTTATVRDWPRWRRWAASGALATVPVGVAIVAPPHTFREPLFWIVLGGLSAAAFGLSRPSVFAQVSSQAIAWLLFVPAIVAAAAALVVDHSFDSGIAGVALASGAALAFAFPSLSTKRAHAEFDPVAYRHSFLVGVMASVAASTITGLVGITSFMSEYPREHLTVGTLALSASFLVSAIGVLRMRAWGVLLGGVTALSVVGAAFFVDVAWSWFAVPGMMLGYPVLASRFGRAGAVREDVRVRVAVTEDADAVQSEPVAECLQPASEAHGDSRRFAL
jgi:hypothetical protein